MAYAQPKAALSPEFEGIVNRWNDFDHLEEVVLGPDRNLCQFNVRTKTPDFECENQYCVVCPRDVVMTVGDEIVEATMSKRSRFFESRPFRPLIRDYFDRDPTMQWTAAPKPLMRDGSYTPGFWDWDE